MEAGKTLREAVLALRDMQATLNERCKSDDLTNAEALALEDMATELEAAIETGEKWVGKMALGDR